MRFTLADCMALEETGAYEAVYSRDVILHIEDKPALFRILHDALVPGGRLLFTDYCRGEEPPSAEFAGYVAGRGYHLHTVAGYDASLREAGFADVESEDWTERFIRIHRAELERLPAAGLPPGDVAALREGWEAKIARAERGEQRWGCFTARRP